MQIFASKVVVPGFSFIASKYISSYKFISINYWCFLFCKNFDSIDNWAKILVIIAKSGKNWGDERRFDSPLYMTHSGYQFSFILDPFLTVRMLYISNMFALFNVMLLWGVKWYTTTCSTLYWYRMWTDISSCSFSQNPDSLSSTSSSLPRWPLYPIPVQLFSNLS